MSVLKNKVNMLIVLSTSKYWKLKKNNMEKYDSKCVQYKGECLEQIEVCKGEDLEKIIININNYLKFILDTINSNILIENVGNGEKIFKGKSGDIIPSYEFKSLLETESLNLKLRKNEIEFSVNEDWLTNYIQNFSTNISSPKNTIITGVLNNVITVDLNTSIFKSEKPFLKILPQLDGTIKWDIDIPTNITSVDKSINVSKNDYTFDLSVPAQKQQTSSDESIIILESFNNKDFKIKNNLISSSDSYIRVEDTIVDGKRQIKIGLNTDSITMGSAQYGFIQDFYGNVNTIPRGWYICDGTNGTPDLRGMFIVGYDPRDSEYNQVGKNGGLKNVTLTENQMPTHTHTGSTSSSGGHHHKLYTNDPQTNSYRTPNADSYIVQFFRDGTNANGYSISASTTSRTAVWGKSSESGEHSHTMSLNNSGGGQSHENRPPFYTMIKIMFKGE